MAAAVMPQRWTGCALLAVALRQGVLGEGGPYQLHDAYVGLDFLGKWDFWREPDPSNGHVEYVDVGTASAASMARATPDRAYLGVDMATQLAPGVKRRSVRLQSKAVYSGGLFVADVEHMPTGCGQWSALWLYGEDAEHEWPAWGEWDIAEVLHNGTSSLTTLHTSQACQQGNIQEGTDFTQRWKHGGTGKLANDCDVNAQDQFHNQGCSQHGPAASAGQVFNERGGGTFAGEWDPQTGHIRSWFWPEGSIPMDVQLHKPRPESWGTPSSYFRLHADNCNPNHFQNMRIVVNVNLCGDMGDPLFGDICPIEAKTMTCEEFVSDPGRMQDSFWSLRKLDVYQRKESAFLIFAGHEHPTAASGSSASPLHVLLRDKKVWAVVLGLAVGSIALGLLGLNMLMRGQADDLHAHSMSLSVLPWAEPHSRSRARSQSREFDIISEWSRGSLTSGSRMVI